MESPPLSAVLAETLAGKGKGKELLLSCLLEMRRSPRLDRGPFLLGVAVVQRVLVLIASKIPLHLTEDVVP